MKGKYIIAVLSTLLLLNMTANLAHSCVGRLLVLAVGDTPDQVVMAEMLSLLVNERTGTTVEFINPGDLKACQEAVKEDKAQIFINYIGSGKQNVQNIGEVANEHELFNIVRQQYLDDYDMVWLKPFGFNGPVNGDGAAAEASIAAPVSTSEVLKRFPVLDRVINKLNNKVDNDTISKLVKKLEKEDVKKVVRDFLKSEKMI